MTFLHEPERGDQIIFKGELLIVKDFPSNNGNFKAEDERGRIHYINTVCDSFTFVNGYKNEGSKPEPITRITPSKRKPDIVGDYEEAILARQEYYYHD
jgi:hypothetical protein